MFDPMRMVPRTAAASARALVVGICLGVALLAPAPLGPSSTRAADPWDGGPAAAVPGRVYRAGAWVRAADAGTAGVPVRIVVRQRDADGAAMGEWSSADVPLTGDFQRISVGATPASGEGRLYLSVVAQGGGGDDAFEVDDVSLDEEDDPSVGALGPAPAPVPFPAETIPVGASSFESGVGGWVADAGSVERVAVPDAPDGSHVARVRGLARGGDVALSAAGMAGATVPPTASEGGTLAAATVAGSRGATLLGDYSRRAAWYTNWAAPSERIAEVPRSAVPAGGPPDTSVTHAIRVEMRDGDPQMPYDQANGGKRHELQTGTVWSTGDVRWVGWWEYVDTWPAVNRDWQIVFQAKQGGGTSPGVDVQEWADTIRLVTPWASVNTPLVAPLPRGRWFHVAIGFRMTTDPSQGWAEMWIDGAQVGTRFAGKTAQIEGSVYMKTGLYRADAITGTSVRYVAGMSVFSDRPAPGASIPPGTAPARADGSAAPVRTPAPTSTPAPTPAPAGPVIRTSPAKGGPPATVPHRRPSPYYAPQ